MMTWTLSYQGKTLPLDTWRISHLKRHVLNQGRDIITFQTDQPRFDCEASVEIFFQGKRWFFGRITQSPTHLSAQAECYTYEASGPLWYLEHLVFQQPWNYFCDAAAEKTVQINRSLCFLGQDKSGQPISAQQCLTELLDYARSHGAPLALGQIQGFDFLFPCETIKDCSCSEVLQKLLRWTPDAVVWIDYAPAIPQLNVVRNAHLKATTVPLNQLSRFSLTPRHDLKVNAVVLKYEHTHSNQHGSWKTTTIDAYPKQSTGEEINALVLTLELEGARTHLQEQWVKVQAIQPDAVSWWQQHFPILNHVKKDSIKIRAVQRNTALPNELLEGAIAPWMHCESAYDTITAQISYDTTDTCVQDRLFSVKICATQAQSKTYRHLTFLREGTPPPTGLAQILYEGTACLQHEGCIQWESQEVQDVFLGQKINFSGGDPSWETLNLPVQEASVQVDTGQIQLKLGAPKQLGPNDLFQLLRANRLRQITEDPQARFAQKRSGSSCTYFPHMTPIVDSLSDHGHYSQLTLGDGQRQIILDAQCLPPHTTMRLKPYDIVENGQLKKVWLLSS